MFRVRVKVYRLLTAPLPQPYSGFAATRAERLRLSVAVTKYLGGYAAEAEPQGGSQVAGKPEAFRTERGRAATERGRAAKMRCYHDGQNASQNYSSCGFRVDDFVCCLHRLALCD